MNDVIWPALLVGALVSSASSATASYAHSITFGATTCTASGSGAATDYNCTTPLADGASGPSLATVTNQDLGNGVGVVTSLTGTITGSGDTTTTFGANSSFVVGYAGEDAANGWPVDVLGTGIPAQKGAWTDGPDLSVMASEENILWKNGEAGPEAGVISLVPQSGDGATNGNHNDNSHLSR